MKAVLISILFTGLIVCFSSDKTVNVGENFVLKKNETARIKGANLQLKMLSAGQAQREEGGDLPFCKFSVEINSRTEEKTLSPGDRTTAGNFSIGLRSVNTKTDSKAADPWSSTSCGFVVTKKK